jgi:hypothetical protein
MSSTVPDVVADRLRSGEDRAVKTLPDSALDTDSDGGSSADEDTEVATSDQVRPEDVDFSIPISELYPTKLKFLRAVTVFAIALPLWTGFLLVGTELSVAQITAGSVPVRPFESLLGYGYFVVALSLGDAVAHAYWDRAPEGVVDQIDIYLVKLGIKAFIVGTAVYALSGVSVVLTFYLLVIMTNVLLLALFVAYLISIPGVIYGLFGGSKTVFRASAVVLLAGTPIIFISDSIIAAVPQDLVVPTAVRVIAYGVSLFISALGVATETMLSDDLAELRSTRREINYLDRLLSADIDALQAAVTDGYPVEIDKREYDLSGFETDETARRKLTEGIELTTAYDTHRRVWEGTESIDGWESGWSLLQTVGRVTHPSRCDNAHDAREAASLFEEIVGLFDEHEQMTDGEHRAGLLRQRFIELTQRLDERGTTSGDDLERLQTLVRETSEILEQIEEPSAGIESHDPAEYLDPSVATEWLQDLDNDELVAQTPWALETVSNSLDVFETVTFDTEQSEEVANELERLLETNRRIAQSTDSGLRATELGQLLVSYDTLFADIDDSTTGRDLTTRFIEQFADDQTDRFWSQREDIRARLDAAETELDEGRVESALTEFQTIVDDLPSSVQAIAADEHERLLQQAREGKKRSQREIRLREQLDDCFDVGGLYRSDLSVTNLLAKTELVDPSDGEVSPEVLSKLSPEATDQATFEKLIQAINSIIESLQRLDKIHRSVAQRELPVSDPLDTVCEITDAVSEDTYTVADPNVEVVLTRLQSVAEALGRAVERAQRYDEVCEMLERLYSNPPVDPVEDCVSTVERQMTGRIGDETFERITHFVETVDTDGWREATWMQQHPAAEYWTETFDDLAEKVELVGPSALRRERTDQLESQRQMAVELRRLDDGASVFPQGNEVGRRGEYTAAEYADAFGSWEQALVAAGIDVQERILDELRRVRDKLGSRPTRDEMKREGDVSPSTVAQYFDTWSAAKQQIEPIQDDRSSSAAAERSEDTAETAETTDTGSSRTELIEELQRLDDGTNLYPYGNKVSQRGQYTLAEYTDEFGSWEEALDAAGIDVQRRLLEELRRVRDEIGRLPTQSEMNRRASVSAATYSRYFDSWSDAKSQVDATPSGTTTDPSSPQTPGGSTGDHVKTNDDDGEADDQTAAGDDADDHRESDDEAADSEEWRRGLTERHNIATLADAPSDGQLDDSILIRVEDTLDEGKEHLTGTYEVTDLDGAYFMFEMHRQHAIGIDWTPGEWYLLDAARVKRVFGSERRLVSSSALRVKPLGETRPDRESVVGVDSDRGWIERSEDPRDTTEEARDKTAENDTGDDEAEPSDDEKDDIGDDDLDTLVDELDDML